MILLVVILLVVILLVVILLVVTLRGRRGPRLPAGGRPPCHWIGRQAGDCGLPAA